MFVDFILGQGYRFLDWERKRVLAAGMSFDEALQRMQAPIFAAQTLLILARRTSPLNGVVE
ncbi:MAG TPA: hypothetical protein VGN16_03950 [Acidobacteriaceae bacterium]|jgi:hypothetical protein